MTLAEFKALIASHPEAFRGVRPHKDEDYARYESTLGHTLPETLKWLLATHGYSFTCGVDSLEESVSHTVACRDTISLPTNWLLLNDWGDAGVVLLELPTGRLCWCGGHNAGNLANGPIDSDADWFDGYPQWVVARLENFIEDEADFNT